MTHAHSQAVSQSRFLRAGKFHWGFPGGASGKELACQHRRCKRLRFDPWVGKIPWRRKWQPTPVFLPRESHGQRSLVHSVHRTAQSRTRLKQLSMHACIGGGNGNLLQYSLLENPRDRGAWWAAIYGVTQSRTRLKWLSSTSSKDITMSEGSQTQKSTHYSIFIKFEYRQNWWHYKSIRAVPFDNRKVGVTGRRHRGYWYAHIVLLDELVVGWFTRMHWICKNSLSYDLWFVKFFCIIFQ